MLRDTVTKPQSTRNAPMTGSESKRCEPFSRQSLLTRLSDLKSMSAKYEGARSGLIEMLESKPESSNDAEEKKSYEVEVCKEVGSIVDAIGVPKKLLGSQVIRIDEAVMEEAKRNLVNELCGEKDTLRAVAGYVDELKRVSGLRGKVRAAIKPTPRWVEPED